MRSSQLAEIIEKAKASRADGNAVAPKKVPAATCAQAMPDAGAIGALPTSDVGDSLPGNALDPDAPTPEAVASAQAMADVDNAAGRKARERTVASGLTLFTDQFGMMRLVITLGAGRCDAVPADSEMALEHVRMLLGGASKQQADNVLAVRRAQARAQGLRRNVDVRVAFDADGGVLLDRGTNDGSAIHIDHRGYRVVPQGQTLFLRGAGLGELPVPEQMTAVDAAEKLREEAFKPWGVPAEHADVLLVLLAEYLRPGTPKPILELIGPAGSRKSTLARNVASIFDPAPSEELPTVRITEEDLIAAVQGRYVLHGDNLSVLKADEQDMLCRVSTGGHLSHRKFHVQHTTVDAAIQNPMVLTGITPVLTRSDARSRTITIALKATRSGYASALEVREGFSALHPTMLGAVCALTSAGLAGVPTVRQQRQFTHRLVDFEQMGEAIHQALGQPPGWFGDLMGEFRRRDAARATEDDTLTNAVLQAVEKIAAGAAPLLKPPSARSWSEAGAVAWTQGGFLIVAVLMKRLLRDVQSISLPQWGPGRGEGTPSNEAGLRKALQHRAPTLEAVGWATELRSISDRSAVLLKRKVGP